MKTIRLEAPRQLTFLATDAPGVLRDGEARVRVHRIGVCGTDIHAFGGRQPFFSYPRILGHELGVEVLEVGSGVTNVRPGDSCSVEPYLNCGRCIACRQGKPNCCTTLKVLGVHVDGGMREQIVLPAAKLHASAALSFDQLALVETLAIGAHAVERAKVQRGEWVLVIGAGPIGLSVTQFAVEAGAKVIALDINARRLEFCRDQLGVTSCIHAAQENAFEQLQKMTNADLPTAVFDATGNPSSMMSAFDYPAHGGRLVFVGLVQGELKFEDADFHRRELTLLSSRNALPGDFARIITLIETARIDTAPWITHRAGFDEVTREFPGWTRPESGVLKAMIEL